MTWCVINWSMIERMQTLPIPPTLLSSLMLRERETGKHWTNPVQSQARTKPTQQFQTATASSMITIIGSSCLKTNSKALHSHCAVLDWCGFGINTAHVSDRQLVNWNVVRFPEDYHLISRIATHLEAFIALLYPPTISNALWGTSFNTQAENFQIFPFTPLLVFSLMWTCQESRLTWG